ncbi:hypothetical protein NC661_11305 [Aquibacillus koreensis]|uniref:Uncharacterized protein n=1 Tax=Aquibacillus koreensis TaxID=279446 RepID=A0A9X4AIG2_9BACI|nr:hypothetical protein [Aquibacillus koreensis]MCT2537697.1 hypothetical protein [Aquibacillus koreensis]MDC3420956.1 hypothetical protein [Aquibacillus koreensis]
MEERLKRAYGSYEIPDEILQLHQLDADLQKEGLSLANIGFKPSATFAPYSISPPDLIPFAETGGDGIHFSFLTDFGQVKDLRHAPIVCVTPTNDPPIRLMARNIKEFFNLASSVPYVELLEPCWACTSEEQIQHECDLFMKDSPFHWAKGREKVLQRFKETFNTKQIEVHAYLSAIIRERETEIAIPTFDTLGVTGAKSDSYLRFKFDFDRTSKVEEELPKMHEFLEQATKEEKLAFIRDANMRYVVAPGYDELILDLLVDVLQSIGLKEEASRMMARE